MSTCMGNCCSPGCRLWCLWWCLFVLFFFPRGVLGEILNLIESVSGGFPSYFWIKYLSYWYDVQNKKLTSLTKVKNALRRENSKRYILYLLLIFKTIWIYSGKLYKYKVSSDDMQSKMEPPDGILRLFAFLVVYAE